MSCQERGIDNRWYADRKDPGNMGSADEFSNTGDIIEWHAAEEIHVWLPLGEYDLDDVFFLEALFSARNVRQHISITNHHEPRGAEQQQLITAQLSALSEAEALEIQRQTILCLLDRDLQSDRTKTYYDAGRRLTKTGEEILEEVEGAQTLAGLKQTASLFPQVQLRDKEIIFIAQADLLTRGGLVGFVSASNEILRIAQERAATQQASAR